MNKTKGVIILLMCLITMISGCSLGPIKLSAEQPYAIELTRVRSFYQIDPIIERLTFMEIDAYAVAMIDNEEKSNIWYAILAGASKDSLESENLRQEFIKSHQLKNAKIINFNTSKDFKIETDWESVTEIEKIKAEDPGLPQNIYDIAQKFPQSNLFNVENVFLFNFPGDKIPPLYYTSFNKAKLDLPRGISKREMTRQATALAEVIYKDNLYGDQVTVDILKLRDAETITEKTTIPETEYTTQTLPATPNAVTWFYANQILNTGRYKTEVYEPIKVDAANPLYGYKVMIEPRKDYLRTYFVLTDENGEYVYFSQSTDKSDEEMLEYLKGIGRGKGMFAYNEFHNSFFTMPKCLKSEDVFLGQSSVVLGDWYARSRRYRNWAKAMVGHTQSQMDFYDVVANKPWFYSTFDILTAEKRSFIYNGMYAKDKTRGKKSVAVGKKAGFFIDIPYSRFNELNYSNGRYVMALNGNLSEEKLLERALRFQSDEISSENLPCEEKHFITFWAKNDFTTGRKSPGHAFISLAHEDNEKQMTVSDGAWGFYPKETGITKENIYNLGEVSGKIVDEIKNATPRDKGFTLLVSDEEYQKILEIKKQWNQKNYQMTVNDCISFVEEVARAIKGLRVPARKRIFNKLEMKPVDLGLFEVPIKPDIDKIGFFPRIFLDELIKLNANSIRVPR